MTVTSTSVAIAFVRAPAEQSPNIRGNDHLAVYYRAMLVAFASVRRWNPDIGLVLVTNQEAPAVFKQALIDLGVTERLVPFRHKPPLGYHATFGASLYMIDALDHQSESDRVVFIDPDVLCVRPLNDMLEACGQLPGALALDYAPDYDVNGLTREQAAVLHGELGEPVQEPPRHFGGECYVVPTPLVPILAVRAEAAWELSLARHSVGETRFTTEEHLMGYVLRATPLVDLSPFVRRIWTAARYRNVDNRESELTLWHLPAEKARGFNRLYSPALNRDSWFWRRDENDFVRLAGQAMGISNRRPLRLVRDLAGAAYARMW